MKNRNKLLSLFVTLFVVFTCVLMNVNYEVKANEEEPKQYDILVEVVNKEGRTRMQGVRVELMTGYNEVIATAVTDANGQAKFVNEKIVTGNTYKLMAYKDGFEDNTQWTFSIYRHRPLDERTIFMKAVEVEKPVEEPVEEEPPVVEEKPIVEEKPMVEEKPVEPETPVIDEETETEDEEIVTDEIDKKEEIEIKDTEVNEEDNMKEKVILLVAGAAVFLGIVLLIMNSKRY